MNLKRISSALIVALVVIIMVLIPSKIVLSILFTIIAIMAMHEYLNAVSKVCTPVKWIGYLSCAMVLATCFIPEEYLWKSMIYFISATILLLFSQIIATDMKTTYKDIVYTFLGICYLIIPISFLFLTNNLENGRILAIFILVATWGTDVFAYVIGSRLGKHKFSKISPNKSIEGCIAGTIGSVVLVVLFALICNKVWNMNINYYLIAAIGLALSLIGQIGDFAASSIKRHVDIKDFSNLLPGHGGIIDRIDSVIFAAPFAYFLLMLI